MTLRDLDARPSLPLPDEVREYVKEAAMTKTLVENDDEYLAAAQQALGTATKEDTVNGLPDLGDEEVMRAAWQR